MTGGAKDPVTPSLRAYIIRRDGGCVVGLLRLARLVARDVGPCRGDRGEERSAYDRRQLTIAHVRDRGKGGRTAKRPPSVARHLVACCYGHHLADPLVDRPDVRDELDDYLEAKEGPDADEGNRPWEAIPRVRGRDQREAATLADADRRQDRRPRSEEGGGTSGSR